MRTAILVIAPMALFAACSTTRYVKAPDTGPVRVAVNEGRTAMQANQAKITSARASITAAQSGAAELLRVAPVDLRPRVAVLQKHLRTAQGELVQANLRTDTALVKLREADARATQLGVEVERLAVAHAQTSDKLEKTTAEANTQRKLAWKWRVIAGGITLAVAGLYLARTQFPFLKLLIP